MSTKKETAPDIHGLKSGTPVPDVKVKTLDGRLQGFRELSGEKGIIVAFVRSLGWCPFCKKQIRELDSIKSELSDLGWTIASLSYDPIDVLATFKEKHSIALELLSDEGSIAIDAFNLRNERVKPGGKSVGVPHPAVVFIGQDGIVKETLQIKGYQKRPDPSEVLSVAAGLN